MSSAKNVLETFREVVQDLLVPELKAVKVSIDSLRSEMKAGDERLEQSMRLRDEKLELSMRLSTEKTEAAIRYLAERFESAIEIRERLATIEARMPKQ